MCILEANCIWQVFLFYRDLYFAVNQRSGHGENSKQGTERQLSLFLCGFLKLGSHTALQCIGCIRRCPNVLKNYFLYSGDGIYYGYW